MIKGTFKRNDSGQIVSFTLTGHAEAGYMAVILSVQEFLH